MPPKPLAEDLARKKAEREKAEKAQQALAILEKPSGFEQTVNAIKDPVGTAKQLGRVAKETFYDPIIGLSESVNPFIKQKPIDRVNKALGGALTAADLVTPFVPEGTMANSLRREAMERVLDDEVARYAASGGGAKYRGALVAHGSPYVGLTNIEARTGSYALPDMKAAYSVDLSQSLADPARFEGMASEVAKYARGLTQRTKLPPSRESGSIYIGRVAPQNRIVRQNLPDGTVRIANDRFDDYVVSSSDIPVIAETRPDWYQDPRHSAPDIGRRDKVQGPGKQGYSKWYGDDWNEASLFSNEESGIIDALKSAPLTPAEKRRVDRLLAELMVRKRKPVGDF